MTESLLRSAANQCFVCGPDNPLGLRLTFRIDGATCRAEFTPGPFHCGYDRLVHGGIVFSALDDVMANWLFLSGIRGHTARCEIRYREPVELGDTLQLEGWLVRRKGRLALMASTAKRASDGTVVAEAEGTFMVMSAAGAAPGLSPL
jgi:acyl-coenzyme A thioesterase PaaI-like protein